MPLTYEQYRTQIVTQTDLLAAALADADMTVPVPSCPGWNVGQLARHLGGVHRWAAEIVRTKPDPLPDQDHFRDLSPYADEDPAVLAPWLREGAAELADALAGTDPDSPVPMPVPDLEPTARWHARRQTHEAAIHRADAQLALGVPYTLDPHVAVDTFDEWAELGALPMHFDIHPQMRELLGPGRTLHFHATDAPEDVHAEWVIDLTGEAITWRRAHEKCAVAVRGPLIDLVLLVYRRISGEHLEFLGDTDLFAFWAERVAFG